MWQFQVRKFSKTDLNSHLKLSFASVKNQTSDDRLKCSFILPLLVVLILVFMFQGDIACYFGMIKYHIHKRVQVKLFTFENDYLTHFRIGP